MAKQLHDVIITILKEVKKPLSPKAIYEKIQSKALWKRPSDDQSPPIEQINARISNYPGFFKRENGQISLNTIPSQKFLRLTWNDNYWETPSGHDWKKNDQGKKGISFENQYGFGHEEWLFSPRFTINEYQYGFIRGLDLKSKSITHLNRAYLYSVLKSDSKNPFYVGYIDSLEIIKHNKEITEKIRPLILKLAPQISAELKSVGADYKRFNEYGFEPVVRFKWEDAHILDEPVPFPEFDLSINKRFKPFDAFIYWKKITEKFESITSNSFNPGKASQSEGYRREGKAYSKNVWRIHSEIVNALQQFLAPDYSIEKNNMSIEKQRFDGNPADLVLQHIDKTISIYEIKTSSCCRRNIRDAIGQLLDYGLHSNPLVVKEFIIVSPAVLNIQEIRFLKALKEKISINISYLQFVKGEKNTFEVSNL